MVADDVVAIVVADDVVAIVSAYEEAEEAISIYVCYKN